MPTTVLREDDGLLTIQVPQAVADELRLKSGSALDVFVEEERMILTPRKNRYSLDQLLKEQAEIEHELPVDRDWIDAPRVGRELI